MRKTDDALKSMMNSRNDKNDMRRRKIILIAGSVLLCTGINVAFHLLGYWTYLLLYIAIVNGVLIGFIIGYCSNKMFEEKTFKVKFLYIGLVIGMFLAIFWVYNQIAIEIHINKDVLNSKPPYISYLRFYLIGLILGIVKSFYYTVVPCVVFFSAIGFLFEIIRNQITKQKREGGKGGE